MIVRFSDVAEFVSELDRDPLAVARRSVRVTQKFRRNSSIDITSLSVIATAKVLSTSSDTERDDYDLVRFERIVGDLWGHRDDEDVKARGASLAQEMTARLEECGFDVLAGEYAEAA